VSQLGNDFDFGQYFAVTVGMIARRFAQWA